MAKKKNTITRETILNFYTEYRLMHGKKPGSVYEFSKNNGFEEGKFYQFFASFEHLEIEFLKELFNYAVDLTVKSKEFELYSPSEKLSCFYFTFFEMATANRSFLKIILDSNASFSFDNLHKLRAVRSSFFEFIRAVLNPPFGMNNEKLMKAQDLFVQEAVWLQFISIFNYWLKDSSSGFEKTDVFVEKSVKAFFDVVYHSPIASVVDLGKFLWKDKFEFTN